MKRLVLASYAQFGVSAGRIEYWASKEAMDIDGVGESIVEKLYEEGLIKDFADLYNLTIDDFMKLELRCAQIIACEPVPKAKKLSVEK